MKRIFSILLMVLLINSVSAQEIDGFVNDYAKVISPSEKAILAGIGKQLQDSGELEYAVVTVPSLEGKAIESYSLELAQGNLGNKEKNNGLLLLVAIEDREYRFEVGRGVEDVLNDAKVGRIGRYYLVPNFQEGNYGKGILEASLAVKSVFLNETDSAYYAVVNEEQNVGVANLVGNIIFYFIFFLIFIGPAYSKKRRKDKYFDAAAMAIILFGGGRGGNMGGNSGFGGFGGGGFSGGGASGGW